ncbi:hypothetical protein CAJAP_10315 [Camponotus japonicus]
MIRMMKKEMCISRPPVFINPMPEYNSQKIDNCCQSVNASSTDKILNFVSKNTDTEISSSRTNINKCSSNERVIQKTPYPDKSSSSVTMDIDNIPILEIPEVQDVYNILQRIESKLFTYIICIQFRINV